jgi:[protein-PII] uridylyltransferase
VVAEHDAARGATRISVFAPDRPGLFYRICAALAAGGASIVDARIHTTRDGMALDNLLVQDAQARAYADKRLRGRLTRAVEAALASDETPPLPKTEPLGPRRAAFTIAPSVIVAGGASSRTTVVEVNARDRPALLASLAGAIHAEGHRLHSAHIATYGERAVDVFYLTGANGKKLGDEEITALRARLFAAVSDL